MNHLVYNRINQAITNKEFLWIVTITENTGSIPGKTGMKMTIDKKGLTIGTIGGGILEHWVKTRVLTEKPSLSVIWRYDLNESFSKEAGMLCGGTLSFFIEPVYQGSPLYIFGAGHCAIALSQLASQCGFLVTVFDERVEWANKEKHPDAFKTIVGDFNHVFNYIPIDFEAYYVIMTQGHKHDETVLKQLIVEDLKYIGLLGSKQKIKISFEQLEKTGINPSLFSKIKAPVGVPIGSHEPIEIAVSIMAEIIALKNKIILE